MSRYYDSDSYDDVTKSRNYGSDSDDEALDWMGRFAEGTKGAHRMQTRFQRIPSSHLNTETIAGIKDMNLGRIKNGQPVGAPTIRFDTGLNTGVNPHINVDPLGSSNAKNPHFEVPSGVIRGADVVNKTLRYAGITLTVAAVVIDAWRIGSAFKDDLYIEENAHKIIRELEDAIKKLNNKLKKTDESITFINIKHTINHLENVLRDVKRTRKVPVKTIKTAASVAGGWCGGLAGGAGGAWAGAKAGAMFGAFFGPAGVTIGAPVGAIFGAIGGGIGGGIAGSKVGKSVANLGLELAD